MKRLPPARVSSSCHLVLPPVIYAVAGREVNLYFQNLILSPPGRVWIFDVACAKGAQQVERWTWVPREEDAGEVPLSIEVRDADDRIVARGETTIRVVSARAGANRPLRLLCIGDSGTHASVYTAELIKLCAGRGQPRLKLLGTHHPPHAVGKGNVHEGYGGWQFQDFVEKYTDYPVPGDHGQPSSPFVFGSPDGPVFDFPRYVRENCGGRSPEYVFVFLGANELGPISTGMDPTEFREAFADPKRMGVFSRIAAKPRLDAEIRQVFRYADRLIAGLRAAGPRTKIGLAPMYPAANQDGFGANYGCSVLKYWPYRKAQHRLVELMIARYGHREAEDLYLVPAFAMLDTAHAYPTEVQPAHARTTTKVVRIVNALHINASGHAQLAEAIFGWLKWSVAQPKGKK